MGREGCVPRLYERLQGKITHSTRPLDLNTTTDQALLRSRCTRPGSALGSILDVFCNSIRNRMSNIRVELALEEDIPRLMEIVNPAFEAGEYSQIVGDTNTPENLLAAGERHLHAWREHARNFSQPFWIKCVHSNPSTGNESIIASAEWLMYDRPRTEQEYSKPCYLLTADWVSDPTERQKAKDLLRPMLDKRIQWFAGNPHAVLIYMATDPAFRRLGAATACVQWGLDQCAKLGIPAYLEASPDGAPVYEKLGFETCDTVQTGSMTCAVMIKWPENMGHNERKPVLTAVEARSL